METKNSHTPGKWIVANNGLDVHKADGSFYEIATAFKKEDAQLISTAPELYNSLVDAVKLIQMLLMPTVDGKIEPKMIENALTSAEGYVKVIRKARGLYGKEGK